MNPQQKFALGVAAIPVRAHEGDVRVLGGKSPKTTCREWLAALWNVVGIDDVTRVLTMLRDHGLSRDYQEVAAAAFDPSDRRHRLVAAHRARIGERRLLAWDTVRLCSVAGWAARAGFLDEDAAWGWMLPASARVASAYASWTELGEHYLLGREFWMESDPTPIRDAITWLTSERKSIWRTPWPEVRPTVAWFASTAPTTRSAEARPQVSLPTALPALLAHLEASQHALWTSPPPASLGYRAPAAANDLAALAREFPALPAEVDVLLRWHDGQDDTPIDEGAARLHPCEAAPLNGTREMRSLGQAACTVDAVRYLPLIGGRGDAPTFVGLALDGAAPGTLVVVDRGARSTREFAPSLSAWLHECAELRDGARRDLLARHPGDVAITPSQRWKLALSALLVELHGGSHSALGILRTFVGTGVYLATLADDWEIRTRGDLEATIKSLLDRIGDSTDDGNLAFEAGRLAFLARAGFATTMLDSREAWTVLSQVAEVVQRRYASWRAYGEDYVAGLASLSEAYVASSTPVLARLLAAGGAWASLPWVTPLDADAAPEPPPPRVVVVPAVPGDHTNLARAVRAAEPGDQFEISEGVYGAIAPTVSIGIFARLGSNAQAVHIVGEVGVPAIRVGDSALVLRGAMLSSPQGDGLNVGGGRVVLDRCLINAPGGIAAVMQVPDARLRVTHCHLGGHALLQIDGTSGFEHTTFGQAFVEATLTIARGVAVVRDCQLALWPGSSVVVRGPEASLHVYDSTLEGSIRRTLDVSEGAQVRLARVEVRGGQFGLHLHGGHASCDGVKFTNQMRGALRMLDGASAVLVDTTITGDACVIAGASADGLLLRDPRLDDAAQTDVLPKAAIVVRGRSRLHAMALEVTQGDAPALDLADDAGCAIANGRLRGVVPVVVRHARCALDRCRIDWASRDHRTSSAIVLDEAAAWLFGCTVASDPPVGTTGTCRVEIARALPDDDALATLAALIGDPRGH